MTDALSKLAQIQGLLGVAIMNPTEITDRGALTNVHLSKLAEQLDPAIGEASSVIGALSTELIRRSLRGGVLQIGRELSGYVAAQVEQEIVEQRPMIEKTAAELATEVARNEVQAVRQAANDQAQQLAARIDDASRQAQAQAETVARDLGGRLEESSRQTHEKIDSVSRVIDDAARQSNAATASLARTLQTEVTAVETRTLETARRVIDDTARQSNAATASLARTLQTEVAAVETRTLETARREFESFKDKARQITLKVKERLDKLETASVQLADLQRAEKRQLLEEIDELRRAEKSLADRLDILERPRGLRRLFAWLFGKNKKPAPAEPVVEVVEEGERA
jgi:hypothetical protein